MSEKPELKTSFREDIAVIPTQKKLQIMKPIISSDFLISLREYLSEQLHFELTKENVYLLTRIPNDLLIERVGGHSSIDKSEIVQAIFETDSHFLICTKNNGVHINNPLLVEKNENIKVEYF